MKIFKAYSAGVVAAAKSKRMTTLIYAITFILALILAIPFHNALSIRAGNSMALSSMIKHFDYTTYTDFMRQAGKALSPLLAEAFWMGVFYLIFTIFFSGGVLAVLNEQNNFTIKNFLSGCGKYFFRFLRLAVYMVISEAIILSLLMFANGAVLAAAYPSVKTEASLFYIFLIGSIIGILLLILLLSISDYAKIILYRDDSKKVFKSIWWSIKFLFRHFFGAYTLFLFLLIAPVIFFILYFLLDSSIGMVSGITIFIMFLIQQIFIWLRTWVKIWFLGGELSYFDMVRQSKIMEAEENPLDQKDNQSPDILESPRTT